MFIRLDQALENKDAGETILMKVGKRALFDRGAALKIPAMNGILIDKPNSWSRRFALMKVTVGM